MSFWERDYNAVFITSFYKNPYIHTSKDTIDKLNREFLLKVARAITLTLLVLANE